MFSVDNQVGRLIETRTSSLATLDEIAAFGARFREVAGKLPGQVVICGDYRGMRILSPDVADKFVAMLTAANPRVERSAILCSPDHATANLQIERTVKQAANPSRRTFRDAGELSAWLGQVLTVEERARLFTFLRAQ
jgi:L-fucose isomerase-like protein